MLELRETGTAVPTGVEQLNPLRRCSDELHLVPADRGVRLQAVLGKQKCGADGSKSPTGVPEVALHQNYTPRCASGKRSPAQLLVFVAALCAICSTTIWASVFSEKLYDGWQYRRSSQCYAWSDDVPSSQGQYALVTVAQVGALAAIMLVLASFHQQSPVHSGVRSRKSQKVLKIMLAVAALVLSVTPAAYPGPSCLNTLDTSDSEHVCQASIPEPHRPDVHASRCTVATDTVVATTNTTSSCLPMTMSSNVICGATRFYIGGGNRSRSMIEAVLNSMDILFGSQGLIWNTDQQLQEKNAACFSAIFNLLCADTAGVCMPEPQGGPCRPNVLCKTACDEVYDVCFGKLAEDLGKVRQYAIDFGRRSGTHFAMLEFVKTSIVRSLVQVSPGDEAAYDELFYTMAYRFAKLAYEISVFHNRTLLQNSGVCESSLRPGALLDADSATVCMHSLVGPNNISMGKVSGATYFDSCPMEPDSPAVVPVEDQAPQRPEVCMRGKIWQRNMLIIYTVVFVVVFGATGLMWHLNHCALGRGGARSEPSPFAAKDLCVLRCQLLFILTVILLTVVGLSLKLMSLSEATMARSTRGVAFSHTQALVGCMLVATSLCCFVAARVTLRLAIPPAPPGATKRRAYRGPSKLAFRLMQTWSVWCRHRRGHLYFLRMFASEVVEVYLQWTAFAHFNTTQDVGYLRLTLVILIFNTAPTPWVMLLRHWRPRMSRDVLTFVVYTGLG